MSEFLSGYSLFLAEAVTIFLLIVALISIKISKKSSSKEDGTLKIKNLNKDIQKNKDILQKKILPEEEYKLMKKKEKKEHKELKKKLKRKKKQCSQEDEAEKLEGEDYQNNNIGKSRGFVIDFHGDLMASDVSKLRREITAVLSIATPDDEVIVNIESPGGAAHSYGLGASQLDRIRKKSIPLTVCVDKVAASGGYMMACVADKIISAPFAITGSIGVMTQIPNINKMLKKHDIDIEHHTAGKYKTTITTLGKNTDEGRKKLKEDLEIIHTLFKNHIVKYRSELDIENIATGEYWMGTNAKEKGLIDEILTSDEYIINLIDKNFDIYSIKYEPKKTVSDKLSAVFSSSFESSLQKIFDKIIESPFKYFK